MYFVSTTQAGTITRGKLPLTAAEALSYAKRQELTPIDIRDQRGRKIAFERLQKEAH